MCAYLTGGLSWHSLRSLTVLFVLGLGVFLDWLSRLAPSRRVILSAASVVIALLALWNFGLMFQFGLHLVSPVGPISFRDAAYNQVVVVPVRASQMLSSFVSRRVHLASQGYYQPANSPASDQAEDAR